MRFPDLFSPKAILLALGLALLLATIPTALQLLYLPAVYERSEQGDEVEAQWLCAERAVRAFSPLLWIDSIGKHIPSWGTHGYMHSWEYRRPWIAMYFINGLSWWCIIVLTWLACRWMWRYRNVQGES